MSFFKMIGGLFGANKEIPKAKAIAEKHDQAPSTNLKATDNSHSKEATGLAAKPELRHSLNETMALSQLLGYSKEQLIAEVTKRLDSAPEGESKETTIANMRNEFEIAWNKVKDTQAPKGEVKAGIVDSEPSQAKAEEIESIKSTLGINSIHGGKDEKDIPPELLKALKSAAASLQVNDEVKVAA